MPFYVSKSGLTPKQIKKNISNFGLESIPLPPPSLNWITTKKTFEQVLAKILEYGPRDRLVIIDYYIGLLLLTRSWVETGRWPSKTPASE